MRECRILDSLIFFNSYLLILCLWAFFNSGKKPKANPVPKIVIGSGISDCQVTPDNFSENLFLHYQQV